MFGSISTRWIFKYTSWFSKGLWITFAKIVNNKLCMLTFNNFKDQNH